VWSGADGSFALDYNTDTTSVIYSADEKKGAVSVAVEERKPQYVVITIGLENGVAHCSKEKFQEYYSKIIDALKSSSPETKIILQSVFPTSKKVSKDTPSISNQKISTANSWIAELAQSKSVRYLNTASALTDSKGNLKSEYDSGDGIHLNSDGYTAVLDYIRTHGYK
jgi:lysophospholipase L1-like esterase